DVLWREEPPLAVRVHNEWRIAVYALHSLRARLRAIVRWLVRRKVRNIQPRPFARFGVPPYILLALAPGSALRVGAGAVVHHAPVGGPCESPFGIHMLAKI